MLAVHATQCKTTNEKQQSSKAAIKKKGVWPTVSKPLCNPLLFTNILKMRRETIHISGLCEMTFRELHKNNLVP